MSDAVQPVDFLALYGTDPQPWALADSLDYTRRLARSHYENFQVVSFLLPKRLHQDFFNVYAFCRWADDLGDELGDSNRSLETLEWWRQELRAMYAGQTRHPVFVALQPTAAARDLPEQLFADLIAAFVQDQTVRRYATLEDVYGYCRHSANPVGRLLLRLCGYPDDDRARLSDFTCTALQLANFWQDVARDWKIGRVYMPLDVMAKHGYSVESLAGDIDRGAASAELRATLAELVGATAKLFEKGLPLIDTVDRRLAIDLELFSRGGQKVLEKIRDQDYDVISRRPVVKKSERFRLLISAVARRLFRGARTGSEPQHAFR